MDLLRLFPCSYRHPPDWFWRVLVSRVRICSTTRQPFTSRKTFRRLVSFTIWYNIGREPSIRLMRRSKRDSFERDLSGRNGPRPAVRTRKRKLQSASRVSSSAVPTSREMTKIASATSTRTSSTKIPIHFKRALHPTSLPHYTVLRLFCHRAGRVCGFALPRERQASWCVPSIVRKAGVFLS